MRAASREAGRHVPFDDDASGSSVGVHPSTLVIRTGVPRSSDRPSAVVALHSSPPAKTDPDGPSGARTSPSAPGLTLAPIGTAVPMRRDRIASKTINARKVAAVVVAIPMTTGATCVTG